jgi:hypothetical protein
MAKGTSLRSLTIIFDICFANVMFGGVARDRRLRAGQARLLASGDASRVERSVGGLLRYECEACHAKLGQKADLSGMLRQWVLSASAKGRVNDRYLGNRQGCG